jgi:hypothetical protein
MLKNVLVFVLIMLVILTEAKEPYFLEGCPLIKLTGKLYHSIMPGAPNYESVQEGDFPSERWFFEPNEQSKKYLRESGVFETIPEDFRPVIENWKDSVDLIQLAASGELENQFETRCNEELILEGWLGSWDTHCYSVFFFEVSKIVN